MTRKNTARSLARAVSFGLAFALVGCSFFMPVDRLRPRAAFDMKCTEAQLRFTELSGDCGKKVGDAYHCTLGVQGCDRQATYVHVPNGDWVMNSTANSSEPSVQKN